jgi:hypothetical protein
MFIVVIFFEGVNIYTEFSGLFYDFLFFIWSYFSLKLSGTFELVLERELILLSGQVNLFRKVSVWLEYIFTISSIIRTRYFFKVCNLIFL